MLSRDRQDMSTLLLYPSDPYLVYRLAHLVPLYHRDFSYQDEIYGHNQRLQYYLPQFAFRQTIFLGIEASVGASRIKQFYERVHNGLR